MIVTHSKAIITLPEPPVPRSFGVHCSSIIRGIALEMGILKNTDGDAVTTLNDAREITDPVALLRISIGLAWEDYYIKNILSQQGVSKHPGEMLLDGIYMTPDGESLDVIITRGKPVHTLRIHEVKATYKSTKTVGDVSSQWMWLSQMKAYCKGAGTNFARLHVLFICNDYTYPIGPSKQIFDIEFTKKEIDDNWELLRDFRDARKGQ